MFVDCPIKFPQGKLVFNSINTSEVITLIPIFRAEISWFFMIFQDPLKRRDGIKLGLVLELQ